MNKIFAPFLPPWVETGLQPAFYDMESGTVLQQTARVYAKVQQLTRLFNEFSEDVSNEINNFENDTNTEIERFEQATNDEIERFEGVVNNTVEDYIDKFVALKDFVDNYFDNLDVQDEIDHKLDEMVEDGTLAEIITDYLQAQVSWTFDSVADMKASTNLIDGSFAKTLGYYSENDGGASQYKIRTKTAGDTPNEGDLIAIGNSLVAELVVKGNAICANQFGATGDGTTDDTEALQLALKYASANKVKLLLNQNSTYVMSDTVYLNSNTHLDLNGSTIQSDGDDALFKPVLTSVLTNGYTGITNITIENGTFRNKIGFVFFHSTNITVKNVFFDGAFKREHLFDLGGCKNVKFINCEVYGNNDITGTYSNECIQTDFATQLGMPYFEAAAYDGIPTEYVLLDGCYFHKKDTDSNCIDAIGTHSHDPNIVSGDINNITIKNSTFEGWYKNAFRLMKGHDIVIEGNKFIPKATTFATDYLSACIEIQSGSTNSDQYDTRDITIRNNECISDNATNDRHFIYLHEYLSDYKVRNVIIEGNTYKCSSKNFINGGNIDNIIVRNNTILDCTYVLNKNNDQYIDNLYVQNNIVNNYTGFLRSALADTSTYWACSHFDDSNNILTNTVNTVPLTVNTSSFNCLLHLGSTQTIENGTNTAITFDNPTNRVCIMSDSQVRVDRAVRKFKVSGKITVKASNTTSYIDQLRVRVWDMKNGSVMKSQEKVFRAVPQFGNWTTIELPEVYIEDNVLGTRDASGPRFIVYVEMSTSGTIQVSNYNTELVVSNW